MHWSSTVYKQKQFKTNVGGFWCERTTGDGLFHWRKCYYGLWTHILARSDGLKIKHLNDGFVSYKNAAFHFTRWWLMVWSGVDYLWIIVMFLSAVWTLILTAPIHCRASIGEQVMKHYISPNLFWWRSKLIYILDGRRVSTFSAIFHFIKEDLTFCLNRRHANLENLLYLLIRFKGQNLKSPCPLCCI